MKKKLITVCLTIFVLCFTMHALAHDHGEEDEKGGFSGSIIIGGAWMSSKSHFETDSKNKRINQLYEDPKTVGEVVPLPFFDINYRFEGGEEIYLGIPFEEELIARIGTRFNMGGLAKIDISLFYKFPEEVWEDPYLTGVDRKETDLTSYGGKISCKTESLGFSYGIESVDVDKDEIGVRYEDLKRDGEIHRFQTSFEMEILSGLMIEPELSYIYANIDGESNRYNGYAGGLRAVKMWSDFVLNISMEAQINDYKKTDPIFNETREDHSFGMMGILTWLKPFGMDQCSVNIGGGFEKTDSNIKFYDSDEYFTFITMGYQF